MKLKGMIDVDTNNYKKLSTFLIFPHCSFKCCKEAGCNICQNSHLAKSKEIDIKKEEIVRRYLNNPLTEAVVLGGLEPFDSELDVMTFIDCLRREYNCQDDIVIYTGYTESEMENGLRNNTPSDILIENWKFIKSHRNIIVKFGRFIPDQKGHFDEVLGVELASSNQYAKYIGGHNA